MLKEVKSAVQFLTKILSWNRQIPKTQLNKFSVSLEKLLHSKYHEHWHPDKPCQGSAYRCIRINAKFVDPSILKAADMSGLAYNDLETLPKEFTIWIDPQDVSYRIGEDGSICDLPIDPSSNASTTDSLFNYKTASQQCHAEVSRQVIIESSPASTLAPC